MRQRRWWPAGLAVVVLIVVAAAFLASPAPDGLERVAADVGFAEQATESDHGLLPGYSVPGLADDGLSTALAGLAGIAIMFVAMVLVGRLLSRRRQAPG